MLTAATTSGAPSAAHSHRGRYGCLQVWTHLVPSCPNHTSVQPVHRQERYTLQGLVNQGTLHYSQALV